MCHDVHMAPAHITTFARLFFCAPMLYIGLRIAIDPGCLVRSAAVVFDALWAFEQQLHGWNWQGRLCQPDRLSLSGRTKHIVRAASIIVSVGAFLVLALRF